MKYAGPSWQHQQWRRCRGYCEELGFSVDVVGVCNALTQLICDHMLSEALRLSGI